jgi:hypothetical protein
MHRSSALVPHVPYTLCLCCAKSLKPSPLMEKVAKVTY